MSVITIVGAGMMGSAIGIPAYENGSEVRIVGTPLDGEIIEHLKRTNEHPTLKRRLPDGMKFFRIEQLSEAMDGAELLVGGVSSFGVDWFGEKILPLVPESMPVLSITKGLLDKPDGTLMTFPALYAERLGGKRLSLNAVGGPCTSYELADHDQTTVTFCGDDINLLRRIKPMFERDYYHISLSTDVTGVETAVAMKNCYALGVTLAVGLSERIEGVGGKQHYNSQAALFGQSVREMRSVLKWLGADDDNIVTGAGDLYVTIFGGRTRMIGTLLGRGMSISDALATLNGVTLESVVIATRAARAVRTSIERGKLNAADFPLLLHIDRILNFGEQVEIPWNAFERETF